MPYLHLFSIPCPYFLHFAMFKQFAILIEIDHSGSLLFHYSYISGTISRTGIVFVDQ